MLLRGVSVIRIPLKFFSIRPEVVTQNLTATLSLYIDKVPAQQVEEVVWAYMQLYGVHDAIIEHAQPPLHEHGVHTCTCIHTYIHTT